MSELKVNKITPKTGTSIQLGESGDTITIPCGATLTNNGTATGFGLSFCTTVKTSPFTATANKGFLINTGSAVTVTLPASPSTGDELIVVDQTGQAATNNITLGRNGSKIKGKCTDAKMATNRGGLRLVYSGSSQGWITATAGNDETATQFAVASGGTETTSGDYKIHTFNSDATFTVSSVNPSTTFSYVVVAGGGGGAGQQNASSAGGGGGGAGGFREGKCSSDPYADSPLDAGTGLTLTAGSYPITVGAGGATWSSPYTTATSRGASGSNSVFSTITSAGGGGGGGRTPQGPAGAVSGGTGGSGGGVGGVGCGISAASGNTPPVSPPQGNNGGTRSGSPQQAAGGGGGATAVGGNGSGNCGGVGGAGATSSINGTPTARAGGGSGGDAGDSQAGGAGGGGASGTFNPGSSAGGPPESNGAAGTANTGGGGGGSGGSNGPYNLGGAGGSGVVIIRYKYQ